MTTITQQEAYKAMTYLFYGQILNTITDPFGELEKLNDVLGCAGESWQEYCAKEEGFPSYNEAVNLVNMVKQFYGSRRKSFTKRFGKAYSNKNLLELMVSKEIMKYSLQ